MGLGGFEHRSGVAVFAICTQRNHFACAKFDFPVRSCWDMGWFGVDILAIGKGNAGENMGTMGAFGAGGRCKRRVASADGPQSRVVRLGF